MNYAISVATQFAGSQHRGRAASQTCSLAASHLSPQLCNLAALQPRSLTVRQPRTLAALKHRRLKASQLRSFMKVSKHPLPSSPAYQLTGSRAN